MFLQDHSWFSIPVKKTFYLATSLQYIHYIVLYFTYFKSRSRKVNWVRDKTSATWSLLQLRQNLSFVSTKTTMSQHTSEHKQVPHILNHHLSKMEIHFWQRMRCQRFAHSRQNDLRHKWLNTSGHSDSSHLSATKRFGQLAPDYGPLLPSA